ncbi:MAG: glycine/sarcosine/betaine reductase complex component C subunit beta [Negativibacillus sp.]
MNCVIKGASYILAHTPDMVMENGTTQTTERIVNPNSDYLKELPSHLRSYEDAVKYLPNQTYIGNMHPDDLGAIPQPWTDARVEGMDKRVGKYGEIMPEDEFYMLMQVCDVFELVMLEKNFVADVKPRFVANPVIDESIVARIHDGVEMSEVEHFVNEEHAEPLKYNDKLVGFVKRAHDVDTNLSAHTMLENLVSKASAVLSLLHLCRQEGVNKEEITYVIDCCEEACGDMNQRGGGNFAKAIAEIAGLQNATGCDVRGFCAGPTHAFINAASLVKAGTHKHVVVLAGGCTAKLGMNGKDHVKKGLPIYEDMIGGFAILLGENDGINPEVDTEHTGRHTVGTGSAPQNVISSLVTTPLDAAGLKITDVDKYSAEMQNPDITKPAGAGDVPLANYKMIAALGVKRGELEKSQLATFPTEHGMVGWAPTQGHIPSGVPYIGVCRDDILAGKINRAMIIGKGSLFLGRMTNLFDGVSVMITKNQGKEEASAVSQEEIKGLIGKAMKDFANALLAQAESDAE